MFTEKNGVLPTGGSFAWYARTVASVTTVYFARSGVFGSLDASWVMGAHALEYGRQVTVCTTQAVTAAWSTAFKGLSALASEQGGGLTLAVNNKPPAAAAVVEVGISAAGLGLARTDTGAVVASVTTASGVHGVHTLPRLYAMACLVVEKAKSAAVVAMVVDGTGQVRAIGVKKPSEGGCQHAEVKAVVLNGGVLSNAVLVVSTLKPCAMCGGLLQALDTGAVKKIYARDDASLAANYEKKLGDADAVQNTWLLDKDVSACKSFKIDGANHDKPFSKQFDEARSAKATDQEKAAWFRKWLTAWKPPKDHYFKDGETKYKNPMGQKAEIGSLKEKITSINGLRQHIGRTDPKNPNANSGMLDPAWKATVESWETYRNDQNEAAHPARIITFIASAPASVDLRKAAQATFERKLAKYGVPEGSAKAAEATNDNVEAVLRHLKAVLGEAGVVIG